MGGRGATMAGQHIQGKDRIYPGSGKGPGEEVAVNWDDPETHYPTEMTERLRDKGFSTRASTDFADESRLSRQQRQIDQLADRYETIYSVTTKKQPIMFGTEDVRSVKGRPMLNIAGYCAAMEDSKGNMVQKVVLNNRQFERTAERQTVAVASGIRERQFVPIDLEKSREYVVTHEMGHALENSLIQKIAKEKGMDWRKSNNRIEKEIYEKVYDMAENDGKMKLKKNEIFLSSYAKTNYAEWFAETFTNLQLSDDPKPIAKALGKFIERYNEK